MILNPPHIPLSPVISLDLETTGLQAWEEDITLIAIKSYGQTYILQPQIYPKEILIQLFSDIRDKVKTVVAHNAKFDGGFIYHHYGVLLKNLHCTQISAQICENGPDHYDFDLVSVLQRWVGVTHKNIEDKEFFQKSFINPVLRKNIGLIPEIVKKQCEYAAEDVEHLIPLYELQIKRIEELGLGVVYQLEHKLLPVLIDMEMRGVRIDKEGWADLVKTYWEPELKKIELELDEEVNRLLLGLKHPFYTKRTTTTHTQFGLFESVPTTTIKTSGTALNYGSQEQLISLIKFLGQECPKDEAGKESLEEGWLEVYLTENDNTPLYKFIQLLLKHRKQSKLLTTYGQNFLDKLDAESNIHTSYTQTQTATGRLSSKQPNLQNIPKAPKNDPSRDVRRFFIARPGYKLITCDMDAAEIRIAADLSQEPLLLGALRDGVDMHSKLASVSYSIVFDKPTIISKSHEPITIDGISYVPEELRDEHKSVVFAKFYKGGAKRVYGVLAEYINSHRKAADRKKVSKAISDALDLEMPVLSKFLDDLITKGQYKGFTNEYGFHRLRYFPKNSYGDIANYPVQSINGEAIKMSMAKLFDKIKEMGWDARICMNIHDELVVEAKDEISEAVANETAVIMSHCLSYFLKTIDGKANYKIANYWKK